MPITDCGIIILAAGSSSRLGKAKQLLPYKNKSLLQHAVDEAMALQSQQVVVVTGANEAEIRLHLQAPFAQVVFNEAWQQGMASSMKAGLRALLSFQSRVSSVIIMLCDQPYVSSQLLNEMIQTEQTSGKGIVACVYNETLGVPALFRAGYFSQLLSLQGSEGAKKIIMQNAHDVAAVPFPLGAVDIDTMHDYEQLMQH